MARTAGIVAEILVQGSPRRRDARLRADVLAQAIGVAVRAAFFSWVDGGRRGSPSDACERALEALREGLGATGDGAGRRR